MHHLAEKEEGLEAPVMGHIDIPLVRVQIRRGNIVKAARIFKQGELYGKIGKGLKYVLDKLLGLSLQFAYISTTKHVRTKLKFVWTCQIMSAHVTYLYWTYVYLVSL